MGRLAKRATSLPDSPQSQHDTHTPVRLKAPNHCSAIRAPISGSFPFKGIGIIPAPVMGYDPPLWELLLYKISPGFRTMTLSGNHASLEPFILVPYMLGLPTRQHIESEGVETCR